MTIASIEKYPTEAAAKKAVQGYLLKINADFPQAQFLVPTFRALIDRYRLEELPDRYFTRAPYKSILRKHIEPRWREYPLDRIKPMAVEQWLKQLQLAPKTKGHIRSVLHLLFECAERWELIEMEKNPITLVRVKGCTKRLRKPRVLTVEQFWDIYNRLPKLYGMMVLLDVSLGLRASELMALRWPDFDFERFTVLVDRTMDHGTVGDVKTEYSREELPLHPDLAAMLLEWREQSPMRGETGWLFANPATGSPYWAGEIQKTHIRRAALEAGLGPGIGWRTFRHTYRSWLDATGAPLKAQQELMRHASITTTMDVYGAVMPKSKRKANTKVVSMLLRKRNREPTAVTPKVVSS